MRSLLIVSTVFLFVGSPEQVSAQKYHTAPVRQSPSHHQHQHHQYRNHRGGSSYQRNSYPRYYGRTWPDPGWSVSGYSGSSSFNFSFPGNSYYGNPWGPYMYNRFGYYSTDAFIAGNPVLFSNGYSLNGFYPILPGQGYSPPAVYPYSNVPGTLPTLPSSPQVNGFPAASNIPLNNALQNDLERWNDPDYLPEPSRKIQKYIIPSTRQARELSLRNQAKGDEYFKKLDYRRAYERYKLAASLTKDLATPRFRKGFSLVALGKYDRAAFEFKQGLELDPSWPSTGENLNELFGPDHLIAKDSMLHQVAEWVKEDIRDPERLFVFGVVLHFDGQTEEAHDVMETAARLAGRGDHFLAFLKPQPVPTDQQTVKQKIGNQPAYVVDPAKTRPPAFESKQPPAQSTQPLGPARSQPPKPLPAPPQKTPRKPAGNNSALPPLPQDADTPGEPLIPLPEPAKSQQQAPLLIPPK
ncbi:tetratricopeptide repeat protein [Gimesia sp.]|uniref:tetratricopeptide repeat protein n=1 Tax=Gimesia sp. TaxID=2024833 RepID=UPI003A8FDF1C